MLIWNPWHGCHKLSAGCQNCYVYRRDSQFGKDSSAVSQTANFDLPARKNRKQEYRLPAGEEIFTCGTSDFFLAEADDWRADAWRFIKQRPDLTFWIITKRIDRFMARLPADWGEGYANAHIGCTAENQDRADYRLPIFLRMPIRHRFIICEPLLEAVDLGPYLLADQIEQVIAGGESGPDGRLCRYDWVLSLREQCAARQIAFRFKQTGTHFQKGDKQYTIPRKKQMSQAHKAGIDWDPQSLPAP